MTDGEGWWLMGSWHGITYPGILCHTPLLALWRRVFCPRGWHLWDEVGSAERHFLSCDACDRLVWLCDSAKDDG